MTGVAVTSTGAAPAGSREAERTPGWWWAACALAATVLLVLWQMAPGTVERSYVARTAGLAAAVGFAFAALRLRPPMRAVWLTIFGYVALVAVTDVLYDWQTFNLDEVPFPGITDVGYLGSYVFAFAGLSMLARIASPGRDTEAWIDSAIIALAVIAVVGSVIIGPTVVAAGTLDAATLTSIAYPLLDVWCSHR